MIARSTTGAGGNPHPIAADRHNGERLIVRTDDWSRDATMIDSPAPGVLTTMKHFAIALVLLCLFISPVHAQNPSHWGVVGGFVPLWKTTSSVEKLGTLVFADDAVELLKGS